MRCSCESAYENASFCSNCGLPLYNFCTDDDCELNQEDTLDCLKESERYCYCCGAESTYLSLGLLKPYEN